MRGDQWSLVSTISLIVLVLLVLLATYFIGWKKVVIGCAVIAVLVIIHNFLPIKIVRVAIYSPKIKQAVAILQITDFHSEGSFRVRQIVKICKQTRPDVVVLSGDLWDIRKTSDDYTARIYRMLTELLNYCPNVLMVAGNHDQRMIGSDRLVRARLDFDGELYRTELPNGFALGDVKLNGLGIESSGLRSLDFQSQQFNLAVCHHPTHASNLIKTNPLVDLVLSGDTHGGQICLPFVGAIVVPGMPTFPECNPDYRPLVRGLSEFNAGKFVLSPKTNSVNPKLYVCTGVGCSGFPPIRLFCRSQVSLITLNPSI